MSYFVSEWNLEWVTNNPEVWLNELYHQMNRIVPIQHWSRKFEYPWIYTKGKFRRGEWVLDAGGGSAPFQYFLRLTECQVINVDLEKEGAQADKVAYVQGDLKSLPFIDNIFDKVVCCSVLEHIVEPEKVVHELWRVLKPGGILVGSFDVADYYRWNHTIDYGVTSNLLKLFHCYLPSFPLKISKMKFPEIERKEDDLTEVELAVLCFSFTKPL